MTARANVDRTNGAEDEEYTFEEHVNDCDIVFVALAVIWHWRRMRTTPLFYLCIERNYVISAVYIYIDFGGRPRLPHSSRRHIVMCQMLCVDCCRHNLLTRCLLLVLLLLIQSGLLLLLSAVWVLCFVQLRICYMYASRTRNSNWNLLVAQK